MHRVELGLKFALDPAGLKGLRQHRALRDLRLAKPVTRSQSAVYFDTDDRQLHARGAVVKVVTIGRRHVQSVKCAMEPPAGSALIRRDAFEDAVADERPDLRLLTGTPLGALGTETELAAALKPVFVSEVRRSLHRLGDAGWAVELVIDEGSIADAEDPEHRLPVAELELRLLDGTPDRLYLVALTLLDRVRLQPLLPPKSERGFALIAGAAAADEVTAEKAAPVDLTPDMTAAEGFRAIARACLGQLVANEPAVRAGLPEGVHQMRVSVRRLKSALSTFTDIFGAATGATVADPLAPGVDPALLTPGDVKAALGWLMSVLGPARDADVFVGETLAGAEKLLGAGPLAALRGAVEDDRRAAWDAVAAALDDPRFARLPLVLGAWIEAGHWLADGGVAPEPFAGLALSDGNLDAAAPEEELVPAVHLSPAPGLEPLGAFAARVLDKRLRKVLRRGRGLGKLAPEARHEVRIQVKKLRYACEFFGGLATDPKQATRFGKRLKALQDALGLLNDIAVARGRLEELAARPALAFGAGMIAGTHAAGQDEVLRTGVSAWKRFVKDADPFWS
ncbi:CYTH and CHAD domain-containing protein [Tistrella mobilis]